MEKNNENKEEHKGLADDHQGDFILNESGTSVSIGLNEDLPPLDNEQGENDTKQAERKDNDSDVTK